MIRFPLKVAARELCRASVVVLVRPKLPDCGNLVKVRRRTVAAAVAALPALPVARPAAARYQTV